MTLLKYKILHNLYKIKIKIKIYIINNFKQLTIMNQIKSSWFNLIQRIRVSI